MSYVGLTDRVERMPDLERRASVAFHALNARLRKYSGAAEGDLEILGEVRAMEGDFIERDLEIVAGAYDSAGRVIATGTISISAAYFYCLELFQLNLGELTELPATIRLFPKPT